MVASNFSRKPNAVIIIIPRVKEPPCDVMCNVPQKQENMSDSLTHCCNKTLKLKMENAFFFFQNQKILQ